MDEIKLYMEEDASFNNNNHIYNHLNYLFRTDSSQKWTNELSKYNCFIDWTGDEIKLYDLPEDLKERVILKNQMKDYIVNKLAAENLTVNHLKMIRFETDTENFDNKTFIDAVIDIMNSIEEFEKIVPIMAMTHIDQEELSPHFHIIFVNYGRKSLRKMLIE